jgi:formylglycine-generating enzyme required for sulfatase activity
VRRVLAAAAAIAAAAALLVVTGAASLARSELRRVARARHAARGETELRVVNPAGAAIELFRAGSSLEDAAPLALPAGETWLEAGRYFVQATLAEERLFFPVTLDGAGEAPDESGTWTLTVRRPVAESPPLLDASGPGFVRVPGGFFLMGDGQNPGQAHPVWVSSFHVAEFEVTNGEFRRFLADPQGFEGRSSWTEAGWRWKTSGLSQPTARLRPTDARYPRFGRDELPVVLVTWHEANAYCRWLTRRLGGGRWLFRMPTEAEWEKAARGPDAFDYGLGMELSEPQAALYNWRKNPGAEVTLVGPREGGYRANRYGVLHASGNAREWTQSVFRRYGAQNPYRDDERNTDDAEGLRVTRGGSWYSASAVRLRLAYREEFQPELSSDDLGFRIVAVLGAGPGDEGRSGSDP